MCARAHARARACVFVCDVCVCVSILFLKDKVIHIYSCVCIHLPLSVFCHGKKKIGREREQREADQEVNRGEKMS